MLLFDLRAEHRSKAVQKLGALARRVREQGVEVAQDNVGEVVIRGGRTQQIGIKLRGVANAGDGAGQKKEELGVVNDLRARGVGEKRGECRERFALFVEPDGATFARAGRNFDGGDARAEALAFAAAGFQIQPDGERLAGGKPFQIGAEVGGGSELRVIGRCGGCLSGGRGCGGGCAEVLEERSKAQLTVERGERSDVGLAPLEKVQIELQRHVGGDGGELLGEHHLFALLLEGFAVALVGNFAGVVQSVFHAAVFADQLGGALFANAFGTGNVVNGVAHEGHHVDHFAGRDAENLLDPRFVHDGVALAATRAGAQDMDAVADELQHVLVVGDEQDIEVFLRGLPGQYADDVVGFVAVEFENGHAHGLAQAAHVGELDGEIVGHGRALGLVLFEELIAEGRGLGVEDDADVVRLVILEQPPQDVAEEEGHLGGHT